MKRLLTSIGFLLAAAASLYANDLQFSADHMTTVLAKGKEHTILSGHAKITNNGTVITANQIELYGPNFRYAQCSGNVDVVDPKRGITLKAQNLFYDRTEDLSRVEGYAQMQDTKNQLVVKGGFLENRGNEEVTIIQIGVRILKVADKQEMACRSEYARYNRKSDSLLLSGNPVVFWKGDEYRASQISINLKTDEINLEGEVSGKITSQNGSQQQSQGGTSSGSGASNGKAGSTQKGATKAAPAPNGKSSGTAQGTAAPSPKPAAPTTGSAP